MNELIYINPCKEDNCKLSELNPDWKKYVVEVYDNALHSY